MVADPRALVPIGPNHLSQAIAAIEAVVHMCAAVVQVARFFAAFHGRMPKDLRVATIHDGRWKQWPPAFSPSGEPCGGLGV